MKYTTPLLLLFCTGCYQRQDPLVREEGGYR